MIRTLALMLLVTLTWRAYTLFSSSNWNASSEAMSLSGALRLIDREPLYPPLEKAWVYPYQPLHAMVSSWIPQYLSLEFRVRAIRAHSILFFGICLFLWVTWIRKFSEHYWLPLLLALPRFADYQAVARNDLLYLCFELAAALYAFEWIRGKRNFLWVVFFSLCSFFTRQLPSPVLLSLLLFQISSRNWRAFLFTGGTALMGGVFFTGAIQHFFPFYLDHVFQAPLIGLKLPWDASIFLFLTTYVVFIALAVVGIRKFPSTAQFQWASLLVLSSLGVGVAGLFRQWSDTNFLLEFLIAASPFVALAWPNLFTRPAFRFVLSLQLLFCISVYALKSSKHRILPADVAQLSHELTARYPEGGFVTGPWNGTLALHLKKWALNGPDVAALVWPSRDGKHLPQLSGSVWVNAGPSALKDALQSRGVFGDKKPLECPAPWLCVYRL